MYSETAIKLSGEKFIEVSAYLLAHESDIALCINDFGDLKSIFIAVLGREPMA